MPAPDATELTARSKFACPACGAEATWNPSRQALMCEFCGTESPAQPARLANAIAEQDLDAGLARAADDRRGWAASKVSVTCRSCRAVSVFDPQRVAQNCEFCGSAQLVRYEETAAVFRPESVLPFRVAEAQARERVRTWYGRVWFAPNALKKQAMTDTLRGIYLPYWTFDAQVEADWSAEAGHYYYTSESYRDGSGNLKTRQVRHVRWEPAAGHVSHFFDDALVCASVGVHPRLLRAIEPFPTGDLKAYDPGYVAGWVVERYQVDLPGAARKAREAMDAHLRALCSKQVPGDTQRNLAVEARWSRRTFKHILVPIWMLSYTYRGRPWQVILNGVTGQAAGEYPKSWVKIAFAVLALLVVLMIVLSAGGGGR